MDFILNLIIKPEILYIDKKVEVLKAYKLILIKKYLNLN